MLFITPARNAKEAKDYFTRSLAQNDYYVKDAAEVPGKWHGLGAELLGLEGRVKQEDFFALCDNRNPETGGRLTARTRAERRVFYDFTFDAPKSVTLAYELGGDGRVRRAFEESVEETMNSMEGAVKARVRRGGSDADRATANLTWASFVHRTARPVDGVPDPQLHCHVVAFNATYDAEEEKWKAAQFGDIVRDKGYYQAEFHSRLAEKLASLGYGIERDGKSFRIAGLDKTTEKKFSRRSQIIEAEAERLNVTDPKAKSELGRKTREAKDPRGASVSDLREEWNARLGQEERAALLMARRGPETRTMNAVQSMDFAIAHSFANESAIPEKKLLQAAMMQSYGKAGPDQIRNESLRDGVLRKEKAGIRYVTTRDVLGEENALCDFVREGRGRKLKLGGSAAWELDPKLSDEQRKAALLILGSRDRVTALRGKAGAGKTRMMKTTINAIEASGKQVFTAASSSDATHGVLKKEGFESAQTLEYLLRNTQLQQRMKGQVLWVDEAGFISTPDMKRLFDLAERQDCRVVLSGDSGQHSAVKRGDALRILEKDGGMKTAVLSEIWRQEKESYRKAVKAISEGDTIGRDGKTRLQAGFSMLEKMRAIVEVDGDGRYRQIAQDYASVTAQKQKDGSSKTALVVSPTHREGDRVTEVIRETLKESGRVGGPERSFLSLKALNLTEAERGLADKYEPGNVVQFHQNAKGFKRGERVTVLNRVGGQVRIERGDGSKSLLPLNEAAKFQLYAPEEVKLAKGDRLRITMNGFVPEARAASPKQKNRLNNGDIFQVEGFTKAGDIRLTNGYVLPKNYGGLAHGYVVTSHASQGKTVDTVLVALGSESLAAANRQQFYVSVSRGREAVRLYTDDKSAMLDAVQRSAARLSAKELMGDQDAKPKRRLDRIRRAFRLQEIQRAYDAVKGRMAEWGLIKQREREVHLGR